MTNERTRLIAFVIGFLVIAPPACGGDGGENTGGAGGGNTGGAGGGNTGGAGQGGAGNTGGGGGSDCEGKMSYPDKDGDGFGDEANPFVGCGAPAEFIAAGGDCQDNDAKIHPEAT